MARSGARRPGVYQLLSEKYPAYPVARLFGDAAKPLPVWAELAPAEQWQDVEQDGQILVVDLVGDRLIRIDPNTGSQTVLAQGGPLAGIRSVAVVGV